MQTEILWQPVLYWRCRQLGCKLGKPPHPRHIDYLATQRVIVVVSHRSELPALRAWYVYADLMSPLAKQFGHVDDGLFTPTNPSIDRLRSPHISGMRRAQKRYSHMAASAVACKFANSARRVFKATREQRDALIPYLSNVLAMRWTIPSSCLLWWRVWL